jgi:hypothetical protein
LPDQIFRIGKGIRTMTIITLSWLSENTAEGDYEDPDVRALLVHEKSVSREKRIS